MVNVEDIRLPISLLTHRKMRILERLAGKAGRKTAWYHLIQLWLHRAQVDPAGTKPMTVAELEMDSDWRGKRGRWHGWMLEAGFLDSVGEDAYLLHDWVEHQTWLSKAPERSALAKAMAEKRWAENHGIEPDALEQCSSSYSITTAKNKTTTKAPDAKPFKASGAAGAPSEEDRPPSGPAVLKGRPLGGLGAGEDLPRTDPPNGKAEGSQEGEGKPDVQEDMLKTTDMLVSRGDALVISSCPMDVLEGKVMLHFPRFLRKEIAEKGSEILATLWARHPSLEWFEQALGSAAKRNGSGRLLDILLDLEPPARVAAKRSR